MKLQTIQEMLEEKFDIIKKTRMTSEVKIKLQKEYDLLMN